MVKSKIGVSTLYSLSQPFQEMTECILRADTPYIEIVDEGLHALNKKRVQTLNDLAASYDLKYTVHAPFADINIASPSKPLLNAMLKRLKKSIRHAAALNCQIWVFHPGLETGVSMFYPGKDWTQNLETSQSLFNFAKNHGVTAAIENVPEPFSFLMKSVEEFKEFYSQADEEIGLVLDIGHANINQQIESFLSSFSDQIVHIHAHDNRGKTDQHLGIGHGNIDWKKTVASIKDISYTEIIAVESIQHVYQSISKLKRLLA